MSGRGKGGKGLGKGTQVIAKEEKVKVPKIPAADAATIRVFQQRMPDVLTNSTIKGMFNDAAEKEQIRIPGKNFPKAWGGTKRDENKPKRPLTALTAYSKFEYKTFAAKYPGLKANATNGEECIRTKMLESWKKMNDKQKSVYQKKADEFNKANGRMKLDKFPTAMKAFELFNKDNSKKSKAENRESWKSIKDTDDGKKYKEQAKKMNADLDERREAYYVKFPHTRPGIVETMKASLISVMVGVGLKQSEDPEDGEADEEKEEEEEYDEEEYEDAETADMD